MAKPRDKLPMLMTLGELVEHLNVDPDGIYELLRNANLPFVSVDGEIRFDKREIDEWIASQN